MIIKAAKEAANLWRQIAKLATPLDAKKPVIIKSDPKNPVDFMAYTDNKKIYIHINNEKKFQKDFENIILPLYARNSHISYDVSKPASRAELLRNLLLDTFLFVDFHEQLHPWVCPNSKFDEKEINLALYAGIKEAEPHLTKSEILYKVNNSKNLIWDVVINTHFLSKVHAYNDNNLDDKIRFVFGKNKRTIEYQPITHYPAGILPIVYLTSASNSTTDIPISLVGSMYTTMSYFDPKTREAAMDVFLKDLNGKKLNRTQSLDTLVAMYKGMVSDVNKKDLADAGIDIKEYTKRIGMIGDLGNANYEDNQRYFVNAMTTIFDTQSLRYDALKGFIKAISKYMSVSQKQGSPDKNTSSHGGGGGGAGESGEDKDDSDGGGSGSGDDQDEGGDDDGSSGSGGGAGDEKSEDEMDENSMADTLDDLMGGLDGKEADDLLGEVANGGARGGAPNKNPPKHVIDTLALIAADEYYKKNAQIIDVRNPTEQNISIDIGNKKKWKLVKSQTLTAAQVAKLNIKQIMVMQKTTGLPWLMDQGNGYFKFNEYKIKELPIKSYTTSKSGIEIPDNFVLFQDTSISMTGPQYVGSKNPFDLLNHMKYGIQKGLYKICKMLDKDFLFGIVDFSDITRYKGLDSFIKIYEARTHPIKEISLVPQCGGTYLDHHVFAKIKKDLKPGKTIGALITDGEIYGDTSSLYSSIVSFVKQPNTAFVFIEIGSSNFGQQMESLSKTTKSVLYHRVRNIKDIKDKLSSVLITYT
jgi:hypothetical protein